MLDPKRGEVWMADLGLTRGHEQAGKRPVLILSEDIYNAGPAGLVVVAPLTSTVRGIPMHVAVHPPEGGLKAQSTILCDQIRAVAKERLFRAVGRISDRTLEVVDERLRMLLCLS